MTIGEVVENVLRLFVATAVNIKAFLTLKLWGGGGGGGGGQLLTVLMLLR